MSMSELRLCVFINNSHCSTENDYLYNALITNKADIKQYKNEEEIDVLFYVITSVLFNIASLENIYEIELTKAQIDLYLIMKEDNYEIIRYLLDGIDYFEPRNETLRRLKLNYEEQCVTLILNCINEDENLMEIFHNVKSDSKSAHKSDN